MSNRSRLGGDQFGGDLFRDRPYLAAANAVSLLGKTLQRSGDTDRADDHAAFGANRGGNAADSFLKFAIVGGKTLSLDLRADFRQLSDPADRALGVGAQRSGSENRLQIPQVKVRQQS